MGELVKFEQYKGVIRNLCNPGLKERHLEEIKNQCDGIQITDDTTLKQLKGQDVDKWKDKIDEISEIASKEYSNERTI